jgi:hypothetical protein
MYLRNGRTTKENLMATFTVTVPDTIAIGRGGEHGTLDVRWDRVPQMVKDHIAAVYFPQYITDAANSGGKDSTGPERVALANKKLQAMYDGVIRSRSAGEPADPVEAEAYRLAKPKIVAALMATPEAKQIPKGTKDRAQWVLDARDEAAGRDPREVDDLVVAFLDAHPDYRKEAKRVVDAKAKLSSAELDAILIAE